MKKASGEGCIIDPKVVSKAGLLNDRSEHFSRQAMLGIHLLPARRPICQPCLCSLIRLHAGVGRALYRTIMVTRFRACPEQSEGPRAESGGVVSGFPGFAVIPDLIGDPASSPPSLPFAFVLPPSYRTPFAILNAARISS